MARTTVPAADAVIDKAYPVLDHGFVRLVDYMGGDARIVQAARVSYGEGTKSVNEDKGLIDHLIRNQHTSPLEQVVLTFHCKMPIFVARQWVRHRTARCLAGDTLLQFDLPGGIRRRGNQLYSIPLKELYRKIQPTTLVEGSTADPYHLAKRMKKAMLRCYNHESQSISHTNLVDIQRTGIKEVIKATFSDGTVLRATPDHPCLTAEGYMEFLPALQKGVQFVGVGKRYGIKSHEVKFSAKELIEEAWLPYPPLPKYEVSDLGRVRSLENTRSRALPTPRLKEITVNPHGYGVVSISKEGKSYTALVHHMVLQTFSGGKPMADKDEETRHLNSNRRDNRAWNLRVGTAKGNAVDRQETGSNQRLCPIMKTAVAWVSEGYEEVYDVEVASADHNFSAGGTIVHNCNEMSGRYSVMPAEFYVPAIDDINGQSMGNKQGRSEGVHSQADEIQGLLQTNGRQSFGVYEELLDSGLSRELARINLPLSTYTEWYWQIDLNNLFHFMRLRMDEHAQKEIRVYAEAIYEIAKLVAPMAVASFDDHIRGSVSFSAREWACIRDRLRDSADGAVLLESEAPLSAKEIERLITKIQTGRQT